MSNACHTIRNVDALEGGAIGKRMIRDSCDTVGDYDIREAGATAKGFLADICYVVKYNDALEAIATKECRIANACHSIARGADSGNRNDCVGTSSDPAHITGSVAVGSESQAGGIRLSIHMHG